MYELIIYVKGDSHYALVTSETLNEFRRDISDDTNYRFIEFTCEVSGHIVGVNREEIGLYTYKEAEKSR